MKKHFLWLYLCSFILVSIPASLVSCNDSDDNSKVVDTSVYNIILDTIKIRDPFIFVDEKTETYYLHFNPYTYKNLQCFSSKDMIHWKDEGYSFTAPDDFWGVKDYWAPDEYEYNGKYYLLVTFSNKEGKRGTFALVSDEPHRNFKPVKNSPLTPENMMALDAALWVDDEGQPWILYCHEWLQVTDGRVVAQKVTKDLKDTVGEPITLFSASQAPWTKPINKDGAHITDAPFLYKASNGELLMIWSGTSRNGHYGIGIARSTTGKIEGPWVHDEETINDFDGGHAMIFKDLDGVLRIAFHSPNSGGKERAVIYRLNDDNGQLSLGLQL
ncbi:MAG: family 43 glycosylhydrolase [Bacteroidales bacterium]|nr:family 43 glycosylhydrolase [Bacteroidales bacterium]